MGRYRSPTVSEMVAAYEGAKSAGLKNVRLGNLGVFVKTDAVNPACGAPGSMRIAHGYI